jgi:hypothetical protein
MKNKPDWIIQMEQAATIALAEVLAEMEEEDDSDIYTIKVEGQQ